MDNTAPEATPEVVSSVSESKEPVSTLPVDYIKGVIESLLFVNEKPVTIDQFKRVLETLTPTEIKTVVDALRHEYASRESGVNIVEIAGGYQMLSNPKYAACIRAFYNTKHKEKLSKPALETLAIVAYKQPVTRADVELIRGVNSDGVVSHLLDKELIKVVGRKDVPGKPFCYGTTRQFLEYFGLKSLQDLPKLEEFPNLVPAAEQGMLPLEGQEAAGGATEPVVESTENQNQVAQVLEPAGQEASNEKQGNS